MRCRGQGGDHMIAKDSTSQFVEGWDWIVAVPDRNTGIWDDVDIRWTGPVLLQDLYIYSERLDASTALAEAVAIRSEVTLVNNSGRTWQGRLQINLTLCGGSQHSMKRCSQAQPVAHLGSALEWTEHVQIPAGTTTMSLKHQVLRRPHLWWPLNMGKQVRHGTLHVLLIKLTVSGAHVDSYHACTGLQLLTCSVCSFRCPCDPQACCADCRISTLQQSACIWTLMGFQMRHKGALASGRFAL